MVASLSLALRGWYVLSFRISESLPVPVRMVHPGGRSGARSCPKDTELRNENPQLAYHQTPPCNMYIVNNWLFSFFLISFLSKYLNSKSMFYCLFLVFFDKFLCFIHGFWILHIVLIADYFSFRISIDCFPNMEVCKTIFY